MLRVARHRRRRLARARHPVGALTGAILPPLAIVDVPHAVVRGDRVTVHVVRPSAGTVTLGVRPPGVVAR